MKRILSAVGIITTLALVGVNATDATAQVPPVASVSPSLAQAGPADPWALPNTTFTPTDMTHMPMVGNGYLGLRVPAIGQGFQGNIGSSGWPIYYNGDRFTTSLVAGLYERRDRSDTISSIPTWSTLTVTVGAKTLNAKVAATEISNYKQTLDIRNAAVVTTFTWTPEAGKPTDVTYSVLANRQRMHLGQAQVTITPRWAGTVSVTGLLDGGSSRRIGVEGRSVDSTSHTTRVALKAAGSNTAAAMSSRLVPGDGVVATSTSVMPSDSASTAGEALAFSVKSGTSYTVSKYVGIATSVAPADAASIAAKTATDAAAAGWGTLVAEHRAAWEKLWAPNIATPGLTGLQAAINSQFYLLYSSLREGVNFSTGPAGLSSDDYAGWIFWDADTWIFPALLAFHPELAKSVVMFRHDTLEQAKATAASWGLKGGVWPWMNGPVGACNVGCGPEEQLHLMSDIALAQWQYFEATGDTGWLEKYGYPVISAVAQFWESKAKLGQDGKYHIGPVHAPDEFAWGVTDESATNAGAIVSLRNATLAARAAGKTPPASWEDIASKINILVDADGTHPEYAGYTNGTIKQADTVLMAYPFEFITDGTVAAADLNRYLAVTDEGGPAMTASVEAIIAAQARQPGCLAYTLFEKSYLPFLRGPYSQFLETQYLHPSAGQGHPAFNFVTGASGFLQAFPYGFAGVRWERDALVVKPMLPPQLATGIRINKLQYQGRAVSIDVGPKSTTVSLSAGDAITIRTDTGDKTLSVDAPITIDTARPDLAATDNLARCASVTASSADRDSPASAAVDGNAYTAWSTAEDSSSFEVAFDGEKTVGSLDIAWGRTTPGKYAIEVRRASGAWKTVASVEGGAGSASWPAVTATALRVAFTGAASVAELSVLDGAGAHVTASLEAPALVSPGATVTVTAVLKSDGGAGAANLKAALSVPSGWRSDALTVPTSIAAGSTARATWRVTAPSSERSGKLEVRATWDGINERRGAVAMSRLLVAVPRTLGGNVEAESAVLAGGAAVNSNHAGYTGSGFVDQLYSGAEVAFAVRATAAGRYSVTIRYANSTGGRTAPFESVPRTVTFAAVGMADTRVTLPTTANWDTWGAATTTLTLPAGETVLRLRVGSGDSGSINIDSLGLGAGLELLEPGVPNALVEAEAAVLTGGVRAASNHAGYTGTGFIDTLYPGADAALTVQVPVAGDYPVAIRYANSTGGRSAPYANVPRTITLSGEGVGDTRVTLPITANWDTWATSTTTLRLPVGLTVLHVKVGSSDSGSVNIDSVQVGSGARPLSAGQRESAVEAESLVLSGGARAATDHTGFTGAGFVDNFYEGATIAGAFELPAHRNYEVTVRYSNAKGETRTVSLIAGGTVRRLDLPTLASWNSWGEVTTTIPLDSGPTAVYVTVEPSDSGAVNIDSVRLR